MMVKVSQIGAAITAALVLSGSKVQAHSFKTGADTVEAFFDGANAVLFSPMSLLPSLALGMFLSLWHSEGLVKAWPALILGHVAGFVLAPMVGPWVIPAALAIGTLVATGAALLSRHFRAAALTLSALTGLFTLLAGLEGHTWLELEPAIYLGIFAAASVAVAIGAGLTRLVLEQLDYDWTRIGLRIVASWLAAVQVMMMAFLMVQ